MPDKSTYTSEEIEQLAQQAGLPLTPAWRDDLVRGSVFALWAKHRLRSLVDASAQTADRSGDASASA